MSDMEHSYDALFAAAIMVVIVGASVLYIVSGNMPAIGYTYDEYLSDLEAQGVSASDLADMQTAASAQAAQQGGMITAGIIISLMLVIGVFWVTISKV